MSFPCHPNQSHTNGEFVDDNDQGGEEVWPAAVWPSNNDSSHCPVATSSSSTETPVPASSSFNGLYTVVFRVVYDHQLAASARGAAVFTPAPSTTSSSPQAVVDYNACCYPPVSHHYQHGYDTKAGGGGGNNYGPPHKYPSVMCGSPELMEWQYNGVDQRASLQAYGQQQQQQQHHHHHHHHHHQQQQHCGGVLPVQTPAGGPTAAAGNGSGGVYLPAAFFTSTPLHHHHHGLQFAHTPGHPHSGAHFAPYGTTPLPAAYAASSVASPPHHMGFAYYNSADRHHSFYMSSTGTGNSSPTPDASPVAAMMEKVSEEELRSAMPQQYLD